MYRVAALIAVVGVGLLATAVVIARYDGVPVGAAEPARPQGVFADRGGDVWGASYFPNVELTSHRGETVRFYDDLIEDKIVAISFIYTSCANTCPVETARMLQVADLLGDRLGKDVFFYSITIDPEHDTQPVLAEFAERWKIPRGWTFLTGARDDIILLRKKLGMRLDDVATGDFDDHTVNVVIGNQKTGRWMKRAPFENPQFLASQLGSWLDDFKLASGSERDYADAPELRRISDGEYIFRNRCSACHTIGEGDLRDTAARHIGPDLYRVTDRRSADWLARWIAEPDVMLEEKDPTAIALYEQYAKLPMPNMRLAEQDVANLLEYIEQESARITALRQAAQGPSGPRP